MQLTVPASNGSGAPQTYFGGWCSAVAFGIFDGGTIALQASYDNGTTWIALSTTFGDTLQFINTNGILDLSLGGTPLIKAVLTGSSGGTSVTLLLEQGFASTKRW